MSHFGRERLIRSGALVVVALAAVVLVGTAALLASTTMREWLGVGGTAPKPAYAVEDSIDVPAELFDGAPFTVLVFANHTCGACRNSASEFSALVGELAARSVPSLLVTGNAPSVAGEEFARQAGFLPTDVRHIELRNLRIERVPLIVVVDQSGTVRLVKEGILQATDRSEILAAAVGQKTS